MEYERISKGKRRRRLGAIEQDILKHLTLRDLLYSHLHSATSTKRFYQLARERAAEQYRRKCAIKRLQEDGYIAAHGEYIRITGKGSEILNTAIDKNIELLKTKEWDHKWRIAAFDIPEKYAPLRRQVRTVLKKAGFLKLQQSIWIFPHECKEIMGLIRRDSELGCYILYGVLESIENEQRLKKMFRIRS